MPGVSENTGRLLCVMFDQALISSNEKLWYEANWFKFTESEARQHIEKLQGSMPIMGLHLWPHGQGEDLGRAIKYQVDKDDFYEWKKQRKWKELF